MRRLVTTAALIGLLLSSQVVASAAPVHRPTPIDRRPPAPNPAGAQDDLVGSDHRSPQHVVAVDSAAGGGPVREVLVTWDRNDPRATGYDVLRDGIRVGEVTVDDNPWDDTQFTDRTAQTGMPHAYAVQARFPDGTAPVAPSFVLAGRADPPAHFIVDQQPGGTDLARAEAAVRAARAAGGGIVAFGARTYRFDGPLVLSNTSGVILRGAGADRTIIAADFPGISDPCAQGGELVVVRGSRETVAGLELARPVTEGDRTISFILDPAPVAVGDVLLLDDAIPARTPATLVDEGATLDPGAGADTRNAYDMGEVIAVDGRSVTLRFPLSQSFSTGTRVRRVTGSVGNSIEGLTLQGRGADERTFYRLLSLDSTVGFRGVDLRARWANRTLVEARGYDIELVDLDAPDGGPAGFDGQPCKYRISIFRAANVRILGGTFGRPGSDREQSFVTVQKAQRVLVRGATFHGSRTYALNEHGSGSRHHVWENNHIAVGPGARFGGVLLGNTTWGFSGPVLIRNTLFENNPRDVYLQENSYGVRVIGNTSRGNQQAVVEAYGWANPQTVATLHGSLRLTIADNVVTDGHGDGVVLGAPRSPWFPFSGVRDVVLRGNRMEVADQPLRIPDGALRERLLVEPTGSLPSWSTPGFPWEAYDRGAP